VQIAHRCRQHVDIAGVWKLRRISRTPRSNLATYTGRFDQVRKLFAATQEVKARRYDAGR
jgi:excinuclease UvrABC ATPase subunit